MAKKKVSKKASKKTTKKSVRKSNPKTKSVSKKTKKLPREPVRKVRKSSKRPKVAKEVAVVSLILNILILPGLGTLIGGKVKQGVWQIALFLVGAILSVILIGIPIMLGAWIWGIFSGVRLIEESK